MYTNFMNISFTGIKHSKRFYPVDKRDKVGDFGFMLKLHVKK